VLSEDTKVQADVFVWQVLILNGEYDRGNCGGNCTGILQGPAMEVFPEANPPVDTYVHPGSGHGVNFNVNATGAYGVIFDFIKKTGL